MPDLFTTRVAMSLPVEPLERLRVIWEAGGDAALSHEAPGLLRDLFDGQDGYLHAIDRVLGPRPQEEPKVFTEAQVNALVAQAHSDGFVAGLAGQRMREGASAIMRGEPGATFGAAVFADQETRRR